MSFEWLQSVVGEYHRPKQWDIVRWAEDHMRPVEASIGSRMTFDLTPWQPPILEAWASPDTEKVVVQSSAQAGKSLCLLTAIAWTICEAPGNIIIGLNTDDAVKDFAAKKFNPHMETCRPVAELLPQQVRGGHGKVGADRKLDMVKIGGHFIQIKSANLSSMRGHTARYVFGDECSKWVKGGIKNAEARASNFTNRGIFLCSTPMYSDKGVEGKTDGVEFNDVWETGTQELWHLQCQNCGELIPCRFRSGDDFIIVWDRERAKLGELEWDFRVVEETARLRCPVCAHEHPQDDSVIRKMNQGGSYVVMNKNPQPGVRSFRFNKIAMPTKIMSWGRLATQFLEAKRSFYLGHRQALVDFMNLELGEPWSLSMADDDEVLTTPEITDLGRGRRVITAGIDCQENHYWLAIREWTEFGVSQLLCFCRCETEAELKVVLGKHGVYDSNPNHYLNKGVGVDIAHLRDMNLAMASRNGWMGLCGSQSQLSWVKYLHDIKRTDGTVADRVYMFFSPVRQAAIGTRMNRGRAFFVDFNSRDAGVMLCRLRDRRDTQDLPDWIIPDPAMGRWSEEYLTQLRAVKIVPEVDKRGKAVDALHSGKNDHAFDCEKMAMIQALRAGVKIFKIDAQQYLKKEEVEKPMEVA